MPGASLEYENTPFTLEHKTGIDLTVSLTLKKPSKNYTGFILRRFGLFLIHLQSAVVRFVVFFLKMDF